MCNLQGDEVSPGHAARRAGFGRVSACHDSVRGNVMRSTHGREGMRRVTTCALLLAVLWVPTTVRAAPSDLPQFHIAGISVEGLRHVSPGIVVAATLLRPGIAYTEEELRQAVDRVERLPFVLAADFSLRKGSVRDTFELVVTVTETSTFFVSADIATAVGFGNFEPTAIPTVGARTFLGGYSEVAVTAATSAITRHDTPRDLHLQASYTHHNLFSRSVAGTLTLTHYTPEYDFSGTSTGLDVRFVVPLGGDHALRLGLGTRRAYQPDCSGIVYDYPCHGDSGTTTGGADWLFDSTDDPFTPRRGSRLEAGGTYFSYWTEKSWGEQSEQEDPPDETYQSHRLHLEAMSFLPLWRNQAFGIGFVLAYGRHETRNRSTFPAGVLHFSSGSAAAGLNARYTADLWQPPDHESFTRVWLESTVGVQRSRTWNDFADGRSDHQKYDRLVASMALVGRVRWGTVRLNLEYRRYWLGWR